MGLAAIRDTIPIPLAVIPKADLIEVMKPQRSCDRIDEGSLGNSLGDDIAEVELQEVNVSHECPVSPCVTNLDENEEDEGNKE